MWILILFHFLVILYIFLAFTVILFLRIAFLIFKNVTGRSRVAITGRRRRRRKACGTVICIGSGGHTTEMLLLIRNINFYNYAPRYYVMASSDTTSYNKVKALEATKRSNTRHYVIKIPRSREVHQSYITSVFTTLHAIVYSIRFVFQIKPDLVLCNGPGTCIPICGLAFLLKVFFIKDVRIVFIESYCRTKTISLTGKILMYLADNFIVQWPNLIEKCKRAEYIGQLM